MDTFSKGKNFSLYLSDNLELMDSMESQSIDLIYSDILYGTGRNFGDYQDIKPDRNIVEQHYIPRFTKMKELLKDNGSIYIHCDWHISHWIRLIMDDIFGYKNLINEIIWCYRSGGAGKNSFRKQHDTIFCTVKVKVTHSISSLKNHTCPTSMDFQIYKNII